MAVFYCFLVGNHGRGRLTPPAPSQVWLNISRSELVFRAPCAGGHFRSGAGSTGGLHTNLIFHHGMGLKIEGFRWAGRSTGGSTNLIFSSGFGVEHRGFSMG